MIVLPSVQPALKDRVGRSLLGECSGAFVVHIACFLGYLNAQILQSLHGCASANEYGSFEWKRFVRSLGLVVEAETRNKGATLGEAHHTIVGTITGK